MKNSSGNILEKTKEFLVFIFSMIFFGILFVISFFVVIIPRWVGDLIKKLNKIK